MTPDQQAQLNRLMLDGEGLEIGATPVLWQPFASQRAMPNAPISQDQVDDSNQKTQMP